MKSLVIAAVAACCTLAAGLVPAQPLEISYGPHPLQRLDLYAPLSGIEYAPVVVLIHAGGWAVGDKCAAGTASATPTCPVPSAILSNLRQHLTATGYVVIAPNYRLTPADIYPAQVDDISAVVAWIRSSAGEAHGCLPNIVVVGESSGANLGAMAALDTYPPLAGFVGFSGMYSLTEPALLEAINARVTQYLGCPAASCPALAKAASPYWQALERKHKSLPPMVLLHGTADIILPTEQTISFRTTNPVNSSLLVLRGYPHAGPAYNSSQVTETVYAFIDQVLAPGPLISEQLRP